MPKIYVNERRLWAWIPLTEKRILTVGLLAEAIYVCALKDPLRAPVCWCASPAKSMHKVPHFLILLMAHHEAETRSSEDVSSLAYAQDPTAYVHMLGCAWRGSYRALALGRRGRCAAL
jgi:hypothetical protein